MVSEAIADRRASSALLTLVFTDVEDSTPIAERFPEAFADLLGAQRRIVRDCFAAHGAEEVSAHEEYFAAFPSATDAVAGAIAAQLALRAHPWPPQGALRVRMGIHTGTPIRTSEGYVGLDVHRAARVTQAGYGGQVLISGATADSLRVEGDHLCELLDLGLHRVKGVSAPEHLYQVMAPGLDRHFPPPRTLGDPANNIPIPPTAILGRDEELAALDILVGRRDIRVVTITGAGGTGKTRLAVQAAMAASLRFLDGVIFVPLASVREAAAFPGAVSQALGLDEPSAGLDALIDYLRPRTMLLVLDNLEQMTASALVVGRLLAECPGIKVLATSREPLHVRGEHEFPLQPLRLPGMPDSFAQAAGSPAVRLFVERAEAVCPGFALSAENAGAISRICSELDGLPLAIELVAARSRLLAPSAILERLASRLSLASGGSRDLPERHQSLRAAVAWSYDLLPDWQRTVFRHMAVFAAGFTFESAAAVLGPGAEDQLLDALEALTTKSLVRASSPSPESRFTMLETIREFGLEALVAAGEAEEARRRHLSFFRTWAMKAANSRDQLVQLEQLGREAGNIRAALRWSLDHDDSANAGLSLAAAMGSFWWQRAPGEGREWLRRAINRAADAPVQVRTVAYYWLTFLGQQLSSPEETVAVAEEAVAFARERGAGPAPLIRVLNILAESLVYTGDLERARETSREAVSLARATGDLQLIGFTLFPSGIIAAARGEAEAAREAWIESAGCFRADGDQLLLATPLSALAWHTMTTGDAAEAEALAEQSLEILRRCGDVPRLTEVLPLLARVRLARGEVEAAAVCLREALEVAIESHFAPRIAQAVLGAAALCALRGASAEAVLLATAASVLARGPEGMGIDRAELERLLSPDERRLPAAEYEEAREAGLRLDRRGAAERAHQAVRHE